MSADYTKLHAMIAAGGGGFGTGIPNRTIDPPIPLRVNIDNIMREIAWMALEWELLVRQQARLSEVEVDAVRSEVAVPRGVNTLVTHYSTLLAIPMTRYFDYALGGDFADGLTGVVRLTRLHHLARSVIGENKRYEPRTLPCPPEPISSGCGERTLVEIIGAGSEGLPNPVQCQTCGWVSDADQYAAYARLLVPQGRRPFV